MATTRVTVDYRDDSDADSTAAMEKEEENAVDDNDQTETAASQCGIADVMAKILEKPVPKHKSIVLAQGQTDREIKRRKRLKENQIEVDGEKLSAEKKKSKDETDSSDDDSETASKKSRLQMRKRKEWEDMARVKPNILDKDHERTLQRIATRGVVQLFNAVRQQQNLLGEKLDNAGSSQRRRDKAVSSMTKKSFLDLLDSTKHKAVSKTEKAEVKGRSEESGGWNILRDDYMMGAKMKDWDKDSEGGDNDSVGVDDDNIMSDSD